MGAVGRRRVQVQRPRQGALRRPAAEGSVGGDGRRVDRVGRGVPGPASHHEHAPVGQDGRVVGDRLGKRRSRRPIGERAVGVDLGEVHAVLDVVAAVHRACEDIERAVGGFRVSVDGRRQRLLRDPGAEAPVRIDDGGVDGGGQRRAVAAAGQVDAAFPNRRGQEERRLGQTAGALPGAEAAVGVELRVIDRVGDRHAGGVGVMVASENIDVAAGRRARVIVHGLGQGRSRGPGADHPGRIDWGDVDLRSVDDAAVLADAAGMIEAAGGIDERMAVVGVRQRRRRGPRRGFRLGRASPEEGSDGESGESSAFDLRG